MTEILIYYGYSQLLCVLPFKRIYYPSLCCRFVLHAPFTSKVVSLVTTNKVVFFIVRFHSIY